jgi:FtsH-binding integral membrane protein
MAAASSGARVRTVVLALLGVALFATAIVPVIASTLHAPRCTAGPMLNAVLATLGVFVFLAARNPPAHRSLIQFAAWSSFAHAAIMLVTSFQVPAQRGVLLASVAVTGLGGVLLMVFAPSRSEAASSLGGDELLPMG